MSAQQGENTMKASKKWNSFKMAAIVLGNTLALVLYLWGPALSSVLAWQFHGRMTGGGSVCRPSGCVDTGDDFSGRVTHGFELHCAPEDLPNNLEVNDHFTSPGGHRWHLDRLDDVYCYNDPTIDPRPPAAGFDTYVGRGNGRYDGQPNFCANWILTDAGEPGDLDKMYIRVTDQPSTPDGAEDNVVAQCAGNVLLEVNPGPTPTLLTKGNHQAHKNP
jgi:hypothetical protein